MKTSRLSFWRVLPAVVLAAPLGCDPTTVQTPLLADTEVLIDKMGVPHLELGAWLRPGCREKPFLMVKWPQAHSSGSDGLSERNLWSLIHIVAVPVL
jgi:hypothetical protein